MPDNRVYDMINLFKFSPTGTGARTVGGSAEYQLRYRTLANDVLDKLWRLWQSNEIGFADIPGYVGYAEVWHGYDIRVHHMFEPTSAAATFATLPEQSKLAAASLIMVHEAVHLARHIPNYIEEEMTCRTLQLIYYQDLLAGRTYTSRVTGASCTAKLLANPPAVAGLLSDYADRVNYYNLAQLVDYIVVTTNEYRPRGLTSAFIAKSFDWWGGISNRWLHTRGYYLQTLAADNNPRSDLILAVLESIRNPVDWMKTKQTAGRLEPIRRALMANSDRVPQFHHRLSRIQTAVHLDVVR